MPAPADGSAIQASAAAVRDALRELTANLLRITRGAGRPEEVLLQVGALAACFAAYREVAEDDLGAGHVASALRFELTPEEDGDEEGWGEWDGAVREMIDGALQVAAAELLAQRPQAAAGRRELFAGYRQIEKMHSKQLRRLLRRGAS